MFADGFVRRRLDVECPSNVSIRTSWNTSVGTSLVVPCTLALAVCSSQSKQLPLRIPSSHTTVAEKIALDVLRHAVNFPVAFRGFCCWYDSFLAFLDA